MRLCSTRGSCRQESRDSDEGGEGGDFWSQTEVGEWRGDMTEGVIAAQISSESML